jgi:hypothetical protein
MYVEDVPLQLDLLLNLTDDVMTSLLPEDAQGEIPVGFAIVGHIGKSYKGQENLIRVTK